MKKILALVLALTMIFALVACGKTEAPAETPSAPAETPADAPAATGPEYTEVTMNWGLTPAPSSGDVESAQRLADNIKAGTDGNVTIEVFGGAALGGEDMMLEGLLSGTVDMANVSPNVVATVAPEMNALCLPFLYDSMESACASIFSQEYTEKINEVLEPYGLHYLGVSYICPRVLTMNEELRTPADANGQVIRVMGGQIFSDIYAAWGLNTTIIAWGECYTAMQQNTVDGIDGGNEPSIDMAFYEVADYNIQTDHVYHAQMTLISTEKWNSFTPATQEAITAAVYEHLDWASKFSYDHWFEDTEGVEKEPYNMTNIHLTEAERQAWIDASAPVYEKYEEIIGADFYGWLTNYAAEKNAAN